MHRLVPRELLGRVTSLDWLISTSLMPVSMIAVGFLGDGIGPRTTLVLAGVVGGTLTLLALLTPGLRDPEREESGAFGEPLARGRPALARRRARRRAAQSGSRRDELGQRRCGVHLRDPAVEPQLVGDRREAPVVERRLERAVLREQRRRRLRADAAARRESGPSRRRAAR